MLGKLALLENQPGLAIEFFENTNFEADPLDRFHLSLAYMETADFDKALSLLESVTAMDNPDIASLAAEYISVLTFVDLPETDQPDDEFIYLLFRYHPHFKKDTIYHKMIHLIDQSEIRHLMKLEYLEFLINRTDFKKAREMYVTVEVPGDQSGLKDYYQKIAYLLDLQAIDNSEFITETGKLPITDKNYLYDVLLHALRQLEKSDTMDLEPDFHILGTWDPFFEQGIIAAVDYYMNVKNDDYYAYDLLIRATVTNPYSIPLYKKIVESSLEMGFDEYAQDGLDVLERLLPADEFSEYERTILPRIKKIRDRFGF
jgi:hypothetical protein